MPDKTPQDPCWICGIERFRHPKPPVIEHPFREGVAPTSPDNHQSELDLIVEGLRDWIEHHNCGTSGSDIEISPNVAVSRLAALIARTAREARIDELVKLRPHFVKTGWAGDHYIYQTGFDISKRIAALEQEASNQ